MKISPSLKNGVITGCAFFFTVTILSVGYATFSSHLSSSDRVGAGSGLTANAWNKIVDSIVELDGRTFGLASSGGNIGIGTASPSAKLDIQGTLKSSNSWVKTNPANVSFVTSGTIGSFTMNCNGGPILIFGNFAVYNTNGWNGVSVDIRTGSSSGPVIRTISGTSTTSWSYGNLSTTIQTLYNCPAGLTDFYLTAGGNPWINYGFYKIEFSAAELSLR